MRIVLAHTDYLERGGEEVAFEAEAELLERAGHEVTRFRASNAELSGLTSLRRAAVTVWNEGLRRQLAEVVTRAKPAVIHFHNTFPWLSPAAYYAAQGGSAVVQTLHNYRLICPGALLLRDGVTCETCVGAVPFAGIAHACYRSSRSATAAVAGSMQLHRAAGTWRRRVHAYIALTDFARSLFVRGGLPPGRIHVKPNFVQPDPGSGAHLGAHYLFVGRLVEEKGVRVLLEAWQQLQTATLRIIGNGPLRPQVCEVAARCSAIEYIGPQPRERVLREMQSARALVFPSLWHEGCPLTVLEAFATGLPVLCSRTGNLRTLVQDGVTGRLFEPGDASELIAAVVSAESDHAGCAAMGARARAHWEREYTARSNLERLEDIYRAALIKARAA